MRRSWLVWAVGVALLALFSFALPGEAEDHPAANKAAAEAGGHPPTAGEPGHKPPDENIPFGPWALDLAVWTIVVFLVLLFVLGKFAWKPMLQGLDQRERSIRAAVEDAQKAREEAQRLRDEVQAERNKIEDVRREIVEEARRNAERLTNEMTAKAKAEIQAERDRLHREMETARDQALQTIWTQTATLASLVASKAIRRQLTLDDHQHLVDEALAEMRQAGNERQRMVASVQS